MSATVILGFVAALFSTSAFVPQAIKAWRTRSTRDISLSTFLAIVIGCGLWVIYAWLQSDLPVLITNGIICLLALSILYLKVRHG